VIVGHVPPGEADRFRWWEPLRHGPARRLPRWFYGEPWPAGIVRPATTARPDTLDLLVRPAVAALRAAGRPTLPSCEGHDCPEDWLRAAHAGLGWDAGQIRGVGLRLRCSETGEARTLRAAGWTVPAFDAWAAPVRAWAGRGRIAWREPSPGPVLATLAAHLPADARARALPGAVEVEVYQPDADRRPATWGRVTRAVSAALGYTRPNGVDRARLG
jgi:hypothetical protein